MFKTKERLPCLRDSVYNVNSAHLNGMMRQEVPRQRIVPVRIQRPAERHRCDVTDIMWWRHNEAVRVTLLYIYRTVNRDE